MIGVATRAGWMDKASTAVADLTGHPTIPARTYLEANHPLLLGALGR